MSGKSTRHLGTGTSTPVSESWNEQTPLLVTQHDEAGPKSTSSVTSNSAYRDNWNWNWHKLRQRASYYVPATEWIPNYSLSQLRGDFLAGITVACILIPQCISYATSLAKLNPLAGLFSASIPGLVYAIFGSSRHLNVAPEAALSLIIHQAVSGIMNDDPHAFPDDPTKMAVAITTIITFQEGVFAFLLGFLRLGFIDVVLSRALLRGFVTAVAFVIAIEQLIPMFGLSVLESSMTPPPANTIEKALFILENLSCIHRSTAIIAFSSLSILVFLRYSKVYLRHRLGEGGGKWRWVQAVPEIFLVVVLSTVLSDVFDWEDQGVKVLGKITVKTHAVPFTFPLHPSNLRFLKATTSTAILISLIGYLDSMVSAKQNSDKYGYSVSSNREWVALGIANIAGSFVPGTLPAYGSITRSRINAETGGTSQMASVICSTIVLLATFFLLPALVYLPTCVLSAIVFLVVISLLAEVPHDACYYWRMRSYTDLLLMILTFTLTIVWNIEVGVIVSFVISLLLVVRRSSKVRISILGRLPGTDRWKPVNEDPNAEELPAGILIIRIRESLDFANTAQLKERLRRIELFGHEKHHPSEEPRRSQARTVGFHMSDVEAIDASAVQIFYELLQTYKSRHVCIFIASLKEPVYASFERAGIIDLVGKDHIYDNLASAMSQVEMTEVPPVIP